MIIDGSYGAAKRQPRYTGTVIPDILTDGGRPDRKGMMDMLLSHEYGTIDDSLTDVDVTVVGEEEKMFAGKVRQTTLGITLKKGAASARFNAYFYAPYECSGQTIIMLDFNSQCPNKYFPAEEIADRGVAAARIVYSEITSDDGDFGNGIAALFPRTDPTCGGKIAMWAYAATVTGRILLERGYAERGKLFVAGHSRLGKTALLAAAQSDIFAGALSNCSGCCGAAVSRRKEGENLRAIYERFPYWFCENFSVYMDREDELPFDQHFLLSLIAPRKVCIVTAEEDVWADTDAQYLNVEISSPLFKDDKIFRGKSYRVGRGIRGENLAFICRKGTHFFSRADWNFFIDFISGAKKGV